MSKQNAPDRPEHFPIPPYYLLLTPSGLECSCSCPLFVSVIIRTEDGGRQTALEDRVRETCPCSCLVTVLVIDFLAFGI